MIDIMNLKSFKVTNNKIKLINISLNIKSFVYSIWF